MNHLQETKKEYKHLRTQEIHGIYIYIKKTNFIKLVFNRFQHDMAYRDFKDLLEEQLLIRYFVINIDKNQKFNGYLTSMVYTCFYKKKF